MKKAVTDANYTEKKTSGQLEFIEVTHIIVSIPKTELRQKLTEQKLMNFVITS